MTITVTGTWQRAMLRALREGVKATRLHNGTYRVPSKSNPGTFHIVSLNAAGKIVHCSDCKGWSRYGRTNPCKHAGATSLAISAQMGATLVPATPYLAAMPVSSSCTGRSQLFQEA